MGELSDLVCVQWHSGAKWGQVLSMRAELEAENEFVDCIPALKASFVDQLEFHYCRLENKRYHFAFAVAEQCMVADLDNALLEV